MAGINLGPGTGGYASQASKSILTQHTYTYQEGRAKVTEHHYELPKGQHTNLVGSFSYRSVSPKAGQLKARIAMESRKLKAQEVKDRKTGKINHKKRERIKGKLKYLQNQLNAEIASSPITRIVVHERDDEEETSDSLESKAYDLLLSSRSAGAAAAVETVSETQE
ncbi:MAG: hypothetical protein HDQ87_01240 [Clostridia bacterium]|nr:hypothetical protein [Clostridia bacterium]